MLAQLDKVKKLLVLAFNTGAAEGESENALRMAIRIARENKITAYELFGQSGTSESVSTAPTYEDIPALKMPFGKHKDKTIRWIAEEDTDYLYWLHSEAYIQKEALRLAIAMAFKVVFKNGEDDET